jgi:hypothetical protein
VSSVMSCVLILPTCVHGMIKHMRPIAASFMWQLACMQGNCNLYACRETPTCMHEGKLQLVCMQGNSNLHACMQGNCSSEPSAADLGLSGSSDLFSRSPGQCILVTVERLLKVEQHFWLDNLYILLKKGSEGDKSSVLDCLGSACNMWLTSVRLQEYEGDYLSSFGGLTIGGGQLYAEGESPFYSI